MAKTIEAIKGNGKCYRVMFADGGDMYFKASNAVEAQRQAEQYDGEVFIVSLPPRTVTVH